MTIPRCVSYMVRQHLVWCRCVCVGQQHLTECRASGETLGESQDCQMMMQEMGQPI